MRREKGKGVQTEMKKILKILAWTAGSLVALILLAIILLQLFFPVDKVRSLAVEKASAALKRPISIKDVSLSLWGGLGVKLDSVTIGNPSGFEGPTFLTTENIDIKLRLLPLLSSEFRVNRLIINKPVLNMVKLADGTNNYTLAKPTDTGLAGAAGSLPPEGQSAAAAVSFDKLEIHGGMLHYSNDSGGFAMQAENLELATDLENPSEGVYSSTGKLRIDSLRVTSKQPVPTVRAELLYAATYNMKQRHVVIDRADFRFNEIDLDLTGEFFHTAGAEKGKATLKAEEVSIEQVLSLLPAQSAKELQNFRVSGDFAVDMDVDYDAKRSGSALVYSGSAVFTDVNLARRDMIGELKFRRIVVDAKPDNARLNVQDGTFDGRPIKANILVTNFAAPEVNGELSGYLDFIFLRPFLPTRGAHQLEGVARFDFQFNGPVKDYRNMNFSGDIAVERGKYSASFLPQPIDSFTLDAYFDQKLVNVREFYGRTASAQLQFQGRVENLVPYILADSVAARDIAMTADGSMKGAIDLVMLQPFLPEARKPKLTGKMNIDLTLSGSTKDLENIRPRGRVSFVNATYADTALPEPIKLFNADLVLSRDTITVEKMQVDFVSSNASFQGKLSEPFPYFLPLKTVDRTKLKKPFFQFRLASTRFDSDKLFPEATPGSEGEAVRKPTDTLPSLLLPDIDGAGTIAIDTLIYTRVEFTNIKGKAKIENRRINIYDITGNAYTGQVAGQTTIDLNDFNAPKYTGQYTATNIEANDFLTRFSKFGGVLFGKVNVNGTFSATGWEPEQFLKSLTMDGDGVMQEGRLTLGANMHQSLQTLGEKAGLNVDKEQLLRTLRSKIKVEDGKVKAEKLTTAISGMGDAEIEGYYTFDNKISFNGAIVLTKELSQNYAARNGLIGGLLLDSKTQRLRIPLVIGGSIEKPEIKIDFAALTSKVKESIKEDTKKAIEEGTKGLLQKLTGDKKK